MSLADDILEGRDIAQELIGEAGRTVTLARLSKTAGDVSKPWRGPSASATYDKTLDVTAVFVDPQVNDLSHIAIATSSIKDAEKIAYIAAADVPDDDLETFTELRDSGVTWKILRAGSVKPGDTTVFYQVELRR